MLWSWVSFCTGPSPPMARGEVCLNWETPWQKAGGMTCYVLFVRHLCVFVLSSEIFGPNFKHRALLGNKIMQAWAKQGFIHYSLPIKNPVVFLVLPNHCHCCRREATHTEEGRKWIWGHTGNLKKKKKKSSLCLAQCETDSFFSAYLMSAAQRLDHYNRFRHLHGIKPKLWKQNEFLNQCDTLTGRTRIIWQFTHRSCEAAAPGSPQTHKSRSHCANTMYWNALNPLFFSSHVWSPLYDHNIHTPYPKWVMTLTCVQNKQHTYLLGAGHFFPRTWSERAQSL